MGAFKQRAGMLLIMEHVSELRPCFTSSPKACHEYLLMTVEEKAGKKIEHLPDVVGQSSVMFKENYQMQTITKHITHRFTTTSPSRYNLTNC